MVKKIEIPPSEFLPDISETALSQILIDLKSPDKQDRERTLELLAIHIVHLIDLDVKGWLLRSIDSNGTEVVVVANDRRVPFNRWLIQCRNAYQTSMEDIATAVGRSISFKPNILLSVTSGGFTKKAYDYVTRVMQLTNLQILMIDVHDLKAMANSEVTISDILSYQTEQAKSTKELQITPFISDVTGSSDGYCFWCTD
jgi:hypothetical protein